MTTFDLVAEPDVAQQGRDHDLEVIRTGKPDLNHLVKWSGLFSQKEIWALYSKLPFYDSDGSIIGTVSFIVDIDDRKRAEDARQESEEKYRNLFNNAEVGIFRSKLDGSEVLEVNRRFLEIVGMSLEEMVGKPSVNLWADPKEREEMVKRLVADGSVQAFEYKMLNKRQGDVRDCLTSLRLYREQGILEGLHPGHHRAQAGGGATSANIGQSQEGIWHHHSSCGICCRDQRSLYCRSSAPIRRPCPRHCHGDGITSG